MTWKIKDKEIRSIHGKTVSVGNNGTVLWQFSSVLVSLVSREQRKGSFRFLSAEDSDCWIFSHRE